MKVQMAKTKQSLALRALIFAPLAVFTLGKMKKPTSLGQSKMMIPSKWGWRFATLALLYVVIYFMFGYFVAWQWEGTSPLLKADDSIPHFIESSALSRDKMPHCQDKSRVVP